MICERKSKVDLGSEAMEKEVRYNFWCANNYQSPFILPTQ